ncbi:MAG: hypothetical protein IPP49_05775 [Saprospiraceae bacterium]|nr:hypothetical protein [Saprospiraceae bacterium]
MFQYRVTAKTDYGIAQLTGNNVEIGIFDMTPAVSDNTDFGLTNVGNEIIKTFKIKMLVWVTLS